MTKMLWLADGQLSAWILEELLFRSWLLR